MCFLRRRPHGGLGFTSLQLHQLNAACMGCKQMVSGVAASEQRVSEETSLATESLTATLCKLRLRCAGQITKCSVFLWLPSPSVARHNLIRHPHTFLSTRSSCPAECRESAAATSADLCTWHAAMGATLLDPHMIATLERLLGISPTRPLRDTATAFTAAFPDAAATAFQALACLLVILKVGGACGHCGMHRPEACSNHTHAHPPTTCPAPSSLLEWLLTVCRMVWRHNGKIALLATFCCSRRGRWCQARGQTPLTHI
jgi:hypothetical protein